MTIFNSYDLLAKTYALDGHVLIVNWTVAMTIFNSYDLVAKTHTIKSVQNGHPQKTKNWVSRPIFA